MESKNFEILIVSEGKVIKCNVNCTIKEKCLEYSFYLIKDWRKINSKKLSPDPKAEFRVCEAGLYHVICFVKKGCEKLILKSQDIRFDTGTKNKVAVSIYGSCVTRDILEYETISCLDLKSYFCRQSIVSSLSMPIRCDMKEVKLTSPFQKRQLHNDFSKNLFSVLASDASEYLIIDLIDERFSLIHYRDSFITNSTSLMESNYIEEPEVIEYKKLNGKYIFDGKDLDEYLDKFSKLILNIYEPEKIIIHKAFMLDNYIDKRGELHKFPINYILENKKVNQRLDYMYNRLINNLGPVHVIDICKNEKIYQIKIKKMLCSYTKNKKDLALADENNKWGLAPMHYHEQYYKAVLLQLYKALMLT